MRVRSVYAIVVSSHRRIAIRNQSSYIRVSQEPPLDSSDGEIARRRQVQTVGLHRYKADVVLVDLAGHPRSSDDRNRRTRWTQPDTTAEERHQVPSRPEREGTRVF